MDLNSKLKLRPSVAVVTKEEHTEFFLSNIRKSIVLKMSSAIAEMLLEFDGNLTLAKWLENKDLNSDQQEELLHLLDFLNKNSILIDVDAVYGEYYELFPRVFNLLEDYHPSHSEVIGSFDQIRKSKVMIVGLGSVGTWVAQSLLMSGVENFIFVDADVVELSNLHRQVGFRESDEGSFKTQVFKNRLFEMRANVNIECINDWLNGDFFTNYQFSNIDLIINCADHPTVDETSRIIGEFAMRESINHIIGGGYNLHQSLIGQVVIPGNSACVECFRINLDDINEIDTSNIFKLENANRKIGSFPPLSSLSASITANEAFKILAGLDNLVMLNQRTEFLMRELNFSNLLMNRRADCKWCGKNGKYYNL